MLANALFSALSILSLASVASSAPATSTTPSDLAKRQGDSTQVTAVAFVGLNLLTLVRVNECIEVQVNVDSTVTEIVDAIRVDALANVGVASLAAVEVCASINGRQPTCDNITGCGLGACLPGYVLNSSGQCVLPPPPNPSSLGRRRRNMSSERSIAQRRSLCPSPNETACSSSGSSTLSNAAVIAHDYVCLDISSSIEACGACGNVCYGSGEGCLNGQCVEMK